MTFKGRLLLARLMLNFFSGENLCRQNWAQ